MKSISVLLFFAIAISSNSQTLPKSLLEPTGLDKEVDYYDAHPASTLRLGMGFNPSNLKEGILQNPITFDTLLPSGKAALTTNLEVYAVNNFDQFKAALNFESKVDVRALKFKGSSELDLKSNYVHSEHGLFLVIKVDVEYGHKSINNVHPTEDAKSYLSKYGPKKFVENYGSRIVYMERQGVKVYYFLTLSETSTNLKIDLFQSLSGSAGFGPVKGEMKEKLALAIEKAHDQKTLHFNVYAEGGEGAPTLKPLLEGVLGTFLKDRGFEQNQETPFLGFEKSIAEHLQKFDFDHAIPVGYWTASIWKLGLVPKGGKYATQYYNEDQENILKELVTTYDNTQNEIYRLKSIRDGHNALSPYLDDDKRQYVNSIALPTLDDYLTKLIKIHSESLDIPDSNALKIRIKAVKAILKMNPLYVSNPNHLDMDKILKTIKINIKKEGHVYKIYSKKLEKVDILIGKPGDFDEGDDASNLLFYNKESHFAKYYDRDSPAGWNSLLNLNGMTDYVFIDSIELANRIINRPWDTKKVNPQKKWNIILRTTNALGQTKSRLIGYDYWSEGDKNGNWLLFPDFNDIDEQIEDFDETTID